MVKRYHDPGDWMQSPTGEFVNFTDYDALAARLAEEQRQHAETLQHNAEIGTALTEARAQPCTRRTPCERGADGYCARCHEEQTP